jgi:hypothetical protein
LKNECQDIVVELAIAKTKEDSTHSLRAKGVRAPTSLGSFAAPTGKEKMAVSL